MKCLQVVLFGAFISVCGGQSGFPGNLTVTSTLKLDDVSTKLGDMNSAGPINGTVLSRSCALLTRQKAEYILSNGTQLSKTFGDYLGTGKTTSSNWSDNGIPDGALINLILDVSASSDINLDLWFTTQKNSPCIAKCKCTGSLFSYTYELSVVCDKDMVTMPGPTAPDWGQCGGTGWTGPTACGSGFTCTVANDFFSQCIPA